MRHALKARDKGEPYQLKSKRKCCVPSCSSADIKAERHDFSWEVICDSIGIASVTFPLETFLCN